MLIHLLDVTSRAACDDAIAAREDKATRAVWQPPTIISQGVMRWNSNAFRLMINYCAACWDAFQKSKWHYHTLIAYTCRASTSEAEEPVFNSKNLSEGYEETAKLYLFVSYLMGFIDIRVRRHDFFFFGQKAWNLTSKFSFSFRLRKIPAFNNK